VEIQLHLIKNIECHSMHWNLIQMQLKRNGMQNGEQGIENMFMNMVLILIFINIDPKKHRFIALYLRMRQTYSNLELFK
jgi:hypothetical protein